MTLKESDVKRISLEIVKRRWFYFTVKQDISLFIYSFFFNKKGFDF